MGIKNYEDLLVWQKSMELAEDVYSLCQKLPKEEIYGLTAQIKRAAVSIPSNIAEGSSRKSIKEYIRFLNISYGSMAELRTQFQLSYRLNFINELEQRAILAKTDEIAKMLNGLINSLTTKFKTLNSGTNND